MSRQLSSPTIALCAALALPDGVPEWVHLLPAGEIRTVDGRGPYRLTDAAAIAAQSIQAGDRLVLDENHATDLAAKTGQSAPARGWIVALQARGDGIWGQVEWTDAGKALISDRAYRHISPVIIHDAAGNVKSLLRASLTNKPNLRGLAALNMEQDMSLLDKLRGPLGLKADDGEEAVIAKVTALAATSTAHTALQTQLTAIGKAAGCSEGADAVAILGAVTGLTDPAKMVPADQVKALQTQFTALQTSVARERAEAFVDGAIKAGKKDVKPLRDHYIARHMRDAAEVEKEINTFISITGPSGASAVPPARDKDGKIALNADQSTAARLLGVDPEAYAKTLAAEAAQEGAL